MASRGRERAFRVLAAFLGLVLALGVGEVAVRLLAAQTQVIVRNPLTDRRFRAGMDRPVYNEERKGEVRIRTNAEGFRTPEFAPKPPDSLRVVLLGDSFTSQIQVEEEHSVAGLLRTREVGGRKLDVVNLGIDGIHTGQEWLVMKEYGAALEPDLVVLQFFAPNDVREACVRTCGGNELRFGLAGGELVTHGRSSRKKLSAWLNRNSYLYRWQKPRVENLVGGIKGWWKARQAGYREVVAENEAGMRESTAPAEGAAPPAATPASSAPESAPAPPAPPKRPPYQGVPEWYWVYLPYDEAWEEAWRITEILVGRIHALCQASGARLVILNAPHHYEVDEGLRQEAFDTLYPYIPRDWWDFQKPHRRMREIAGKLGVPFVEPLEALQAHWRAGGPSTHYPRGHYTVEGSAVVEGVLLETLRELAGGESSD